MNTESANNPVAAVIRHVPHEGLGLIEESLAAAGVSHRYYHPSEVNGDMGRLDYLIILGGPWSVYDNFPWLEAETELIEHAIDKGIPLLGICLGAQLIARTLGAKVAPCGFKEIGWYPLNLTGDGSSDNVMGNLEAEETVFQWHGDTFDIPEAAVHLASSPNCPNQAFRYGDSTWALQFHLEVTPEMVNAWLEVPENQLEVQAAFGNSKSEEIKKDTGIYAERLNELGARAFRSFLDPSLRSG